MKKIAFLCSLCLIATVALAHEVPVPHAHPEYVHGIVPFLQFVVLPLVVAWASVKLYRHLRSSDQA